LIPLRTRHKKGEERQVALVPPETWSTDLATVSISITFSCPSSWRTSTYSVHHGAVPTIISSGICNGFQQVFVCRGPPAQPPNLWLAAASNHSSISSMSAHTNVITGMIHYTELTSDNRFTSNGTWQYPQKLLWKLLSSGMWRVEW
jgi:hypothetical protein